MKKGPNLTTEKISDNKLNKKSHQQFKFELSPHNLDCFKSKQTSIKSKCKMETLKELKNIVNKKPQTKINELPKSLQLTTKQRRKNSSIKNNFNQQVVFMQYDNIEVYIDNSNQKKLNDERSLSCQDKKKIETILDIDQDIAQACVRVITQETDTSNNFSFKTPSSLTPRSNYYTSQELYQQYFPSIPQMTNKIEGNKSYIIDFENIQVDGRTTVMIKNIPIRYNQQTLLSEFSQNHEYTFDFFYLPIDKNSDCNVGYAFVNFINPSFLKAFYLQFHNKKWKKYKSMKICNICYARCQGTLQLANHFRHSKVLQQKDRKLKPLIGISEANCKKSIQQIIRIQKERE